MDQKSLPELLEEQWLLRLEHFNHMASEEQAHWFESVLDAKGEEFKGEEFIAGLKRAWSLWPIPVLVIPSCFASWLNRVIYQLAIPLIQWKKACWRGYKVLKQKMILREN
jgi:hypothetical protein